MSNPAASPVKRTTRQRVAINDLFDGERAFLTAQQVHEELRERGVKVGLATVYRNLQAMSEEGELDTIRAEDGEMAYRRCSSSHHHHLVCRQCGKVVEIGQDQMIESWASAVAARHGFSETGHELELFGLCAECSRENS
ncbi:Fur family transcriptional regulator [Acidipropionibacterium jensenii]|uniref:Ferric uptake regulation protein n=1 Tax=Acidipropionibacterium jensenii TaxID=1749 RepID=A0A3S4UPR3_9ACTN|nr:transcriptional repressor [Acidipropionibacterium jensenii]MDN6619040.1 transcriptional repressor [Corynebacterium variabile]AZZ39629.1 transcriptional repressor [Acidipropionibacterium jensenii]AZZ41941.1 transcriptional repressor [Acidipropionibacterium jensenii]MDN5978368.1 transcriptional repressor [Acidipropionibacterium jensenii]MDN5995900.1 transcriptional repressor [Acidipropionibacterium jensenii]